ncbi:MAG: cobalamin biosynthesis protein [Nitrospirales bacterium]|nr:cobalamin biosynthesis protein [Nitrospirales bacterium]
MNPFQKKLLAGLIVMAVLSPLGIVLPMLFKSGDAWGEWGTDSMEKLLGYIPAGMKRIADIWSAPVTDYNFGSESSSLTTQIVSYILSGIIGITAVACVVYLITRIIRPGDGK